MDVHVKIDNYIFSTVPFKLETWTTSVSSTPLVQWSRCLVHCYRMHLIFSYSSEYHKWDGLFPFHNFNYHFISFFINSSTLLQIEIRFAKIRVKRNVFSSTGRNLINNAQIPNYPRRRNGIRTYTVSPNFMNVLLPYCPLGYCKFWNIYIYSLNFSRR